MKSVLLTVQGPRVHLPHFIVLQDSEPLVEVVWFAVVMV